MSRKVVGWGTREGVGCSLLEPEQSTQIEESLARTSWVVQVVKGLDYCSTGMIFKQIRYVRNPLRHMGNTRVKY